MTPTTSSKGHSPVRVPPPSIERFKDAAGNWLDEEGWPHHTVTIACCDYEETHDIPINVDGIVRACCHKCGKYPQVSVVE